MSATAHLNLGLRIFFSEFVRVSLRHPSQALFFARTVLWQAGAARRRARVAAEGITVPPIAIFSITNKCNLRCKGCYAQAIRGDAPEEFSAEALRGVVAEAEELGVSFFVIAGGEPLVRPEIVDITREFRTVIFLLVTNGLLLDDELVSRLKEQPNTVPVLSIEGNEAETDGRRGAGVHERLRHRMEELKRAGVFFSLSFTITRNNFQTVTDPGFIESAIREGCRLFLFLEYTPIREGTEDWVITDAQRDEMKGLVASFPEPFQGCVHRRPLGRGRAGRLPRIGPGVRAHQRRGGPGAVPVRAVFGREPEADGPERSAPVAFPCRDAGES